MRISKVKWLNDRLSVVYEEERASGEDVGSFSLEVPERPAPKFFTALTGLLPFWIDSLELPKGKMEVYGATFFYHAQSLTMSAIIHGKRYLERSNIQHPMNSPKKIEPNPENDDPTSAMSKEYFSAIQKLIEETKKFVSGMREQTKLDLPKSKNKVA